MRKNLSPACELPSLDSRPLTLDRSGVAWESNTSTVGRSLDRPRNTFSSFQGMRGFRPEQGPVQLESRFRRREVERPRGAFTSLERRLGQS